MIELTNVELFKSLVDIMDGEKIFDFHNEYRCVKINFESKNLELTFRKDQNSSIVILQFVEAEICKFEIGLGFANSYKLDLFYRGRYEDEGKLFEFSPLGKRYFYINFLDGDYLEILTKDVFLIYE
jgi:hypothetical protein